MKTQKGITLIALIITIIVMLILVGVSVTVALNGGLFETAQDATDRTKAERDREYNLSSGRIKVGDIWYDSLEDYEKGIESENQTDTVGGNETGTQYTIGTEVTIGETGENFYVIKDNGERLVLLAKYNIKADGENWVQDTSGDSNDCVMSANLDLTVTEEEDLNEKLKNDATSAVYKASQYAENTIGNGATGRLMTYREAEPLAQSNDEDIIKMLCGTYSEGKYLSYWLGTSCGPIHDRAGAFFISGYGGSVELSGYPAFLEGYGVRPVLEISASSVTLVP